MNIRELKESDRIIFETLAGSRCYGTAIPPGPDGKGGSDTDIRGVFLNTNRDVFSLFPAPIQVSDEKQDTVFYELRRFIQLALDNNPSVIEYLFVPDDCIRIMKPEWKLFVDNRHLFVSKKAKFTFAGYSFSQIKKAKGQNKLVHNPKPSIPPKRDDFCWFISCGEDNRYGHGNSGRPVNVLSAYDYKFKVAMDLTKYNASKLEHGQDGYRLYYYGDKAAGVFHNGNIVLSSIPLEDECQYAGILFYNDDAYQKEKNDWKNYWDWVKNRNDARWESQENGEMDFDAKNMSHCVRLLISGINILKNGEPIVRLTGADLELVRAIRAGKYKYEEIMAMANDLEAQLNSLYETTTLRHEPDRKAVDRLYCSVIGV